MDGIGPMLQHRAMLSSWNGGFAWVWNAALMYTNVLTSQPRKLGRMARCATRPHPFHLPGYEDPGG
jgi:hypothetical protein